MTICPSCGSESPDGFRFCGSCGVEFAEHEPRDVRKTVTVLFCDLVGYTSTSEGLDPEALRRLQTRYFDDARAALERHGGTVEKFIGDAVMAVFGIPRLHEDDALRALRAAHELRAAVIDLGLHARIGVATGEVVAGAGDALVTGDAVNTAARLEQAAATDEILIADATFRLCRDAVQVESVEPLDLKGKHDPVVAHRLARVLVGAPARARRFDVPLVGRGSELTRLREGFDRAVSERRCHMVTVLGVAGVGKSRLGASFVDVIGSSATAWRGRCLSYGDGITYWPLREVFREASAGDVLEEALSQPSPAETALAVRTFLERAARERPLVLVFDDLHWAEPTLLDLLEHLADLVRDAPLLLVGLARPEFLDDRPSWGSRPNATSIHLEPLTPVESEELIAELAEGHQVEAGVVQRIVEGAEGNPLFVEEMLALVTDEDASGVDVPATINAVLAARLEGLPLAERRILEIAAVEGKTFHLSAVAALAPADLQADVLAALVSLVGKDLVRPDPHEGGQDAFVFRHQLIRDVAYSELGKAERGRLHERFAGWIATSSMATAELDEVIGYHLERSFTLRAELGTDDDVLALGRRAGAVLARAGVQVIGRGDMPAAANLFGRAAALFPVGDRERVEILPDLGAALTGTGALHEADVVLTEAVEHARRIGDVGLEARAVGEQLQLLNATDPEGHVEMARSEGERFVAALAGSADHRALATAWLLIAQADLNACRFADMERTLQQALQHAERAGDLRQRAEALLLLAIAAANIPEPASVGITRLERLRESVVSGSAAEAAILVELGVLTSMGGELDGARRLVERGRAIFRELGIEVWWAAFGMEASLVERYAGDLVEQERLLRRSCDVLEAMGERSFHSTAAAFLAFVLEELGHLDEAEGWTHRSEDEASSEDLPSQVAWRQARARVLVRRGTLPEAERLGREAVALAEQSDDYAMLATALLGLVDVLGPSGEPVKRRAMLERALELFERRGIVRQAMQARAKLGELNEER